MLRILLLLSFVISTFANAQDKHFTPPDYKAIKIATNDKNSHYYHPALMSRYKKNDNTLDSIEYRYLYYGYFFNKGSVDFEKKDTLRKEIRAISGNKNHSEGELLRLVDITKQYLDLDPFALDEIEMLYYVSRRLEDTVTSLNCMYKLRGMVSTILSTGDGKTDSTGYHVVDVSHEYFILSTFDYRSKGQILTAHPCDYLELEPNNDNIEGMYFDVTQIFEGYKDIFSDSPLGEEKKT